MGTSRASATQSVVLFMNNFFTKADSGIISEPFAFPRSGGYFWYSTGLNDRNSYGYYWSSYTHSTTYSRGQSFGSTFFLPHDGSYEGYGFMVR